MNKQGFDNQSIRVYTVARLNKLHFSGLVAQLVRATNYENRL